MINFPHPFHRGHSFAYLLQKFIHMESFAGILLVATAVLALLVANSPLAGVYDAALNKTYFSIGFWAKDGAELLGVKRSVLHWINDGMMVVFFFLVGLEIKRELKEGELSSYDRAAVPFLGALGGMAAPAAIFLFLVAGNPDLTRGWAIPAATDIAFTLGVMSLLGARVPLALKVLVTAIAIIDDLGAIVIIALFYTDALVLPSLAVAMAAIAALVYMNWRGVSRIAPYIAVGVVLWLAVLESGVHATLAGVVLAFCIPLRCRKDPGYSPTKDLEHKLHPWVAYFVIPVFGFANAGVSFAGMTWQNLFDPLVLGIAAGLFLGKQVGIMSAFALGHVAGFARKPQGLTWAQVYAAAVLCGIGFTMSLFIGTLAFQDAVLQAEVRLGVLLGSVSSAIIGYALLRMATRPA